MPKIPRSLSWGAGRVVWRMSTIKIAFKWYITQPATVGRVTCSQTKGFKERELRCLRPSRSTGRGMETLPEHKSRPWGKHLPFLSNSRLKSARSTTGVNRRCSAASCPSVCPSTRPFVSQQLKTRPGAVPPSCPGQGRPCPCRCFGDRRAQGGVSLAGERRRDCKGPCQENQKKAIFLLCPVKGIMALLKNHSIS